MWGHESNTQGGNYDHEEDEDLRGAASAAAQYGGGDRGIFAEVLNQVGQMKSNLANESIDQNDAVQSHKNYYGEQNGGSEATERSMGSAAAMQALKMFTGGGASAGASTASTGGQSQFIGLAMSEASKLFDSQASQGTLAAGANKQTVIMQAAQTALQMFMQSKGSGSSGATGSSGGLGGLLSMASKFM